MVNKFILRCRNPLREDFSTRNTLNGSGVFRSKKEPSKDFNSFNLKLLKSFKPFSDKVDHFAKYHVKIGPIVFKLCGHKHTVATFLH